MPKRPVLLPEKVYLTYKMMLQRFLRSKKAQGAEGAGFSTTHVVSLGIDFVVIVVIAGIFIGSSSTFAAGPTEQSGEETLNRVINAMQKVVNGSAKKAVAENIGFSGDQVLIIFEEDPSYIVKDLCGINEDVEKPNKCFPPENFCACIYDEDNLDDPPHSCKTAKSNASLTFYGVYAESYEDFNRANQGAAYPGIEGMAYPVIYSNCGTSGKDLGMINLLVENDDGYIKISDNACGNGKGEVCRRGCEGGTHLPDLDDTCTRPNQPNCCRMT